MQVHLVDGTYELFRYFYSPGGGHRNAQDREVGAVRGVLRSLVAMLDDGATHVGVATDHVIESFRNELYAGYKTGEGIDPELRQQFPLLEDALRSAGFTVWPMVEVEADDALGAAAAVAEADPSVTRAIICTPDKDLAQCVRDPKVVQFDRRAGVFRDTAGVIEKFGVEPESIPDWLGLVGDTADGFPGLAGHRPAPVPPHRAHPAASGPVGHHRAGQRQALRHPCGAPRRRAAVPPDRHARVRCSRRDAGRLALGRTQRRVRRDVRAARRTRRAGEGAAARDGPVSVSARSRHRTAR
jgi:hypothetical protein